MFYSSLMLFIVFLFYATIFSYISRARNWIIPGSSRPKVDSQRCPYSNLLWLINKRNLDTVDWRWRCKFIYSDANQLPNNNAIRLHSWGLAIITVCTGWPKNCIFPCLMLNWYSFVKSQPNFIIFGRELHLNKFPTKQCIYCPQHLLRVSTLPCRNNIVLFLCCLKMKFAHELCWQTTK